jgi:hypothetical protein
MEEIIHYLRIDSPINPGDVRYAEEVVKSGYVKPLRPNMKICGLPKPACLVCLRFYHCDKAQNEKERAACPVYQNMEAGRLVEVCV